jgi:hypothetical protein
MRQELKGDTLAEAKPEDVTCSEFLQICKANVFLKKKNETLPQNTITSITKSTPQTTIIRKAKHKLATET